MNRNSFTIGLKAPLVLAVLALMLALITACGASQGEQPLPSPVVGALTTAGQHDGERVVVEGYLVTDATISCGLDSICWLWLAAAPEGEDGVTYSQPDEFILIGIYQKDGSPYPNTLTRIPMPWKPEDILVMADDMREVHLNDRVRVTGWVEVDEDGYVRVTGPSPCEGVSGEDRLRLFEIHQCPETGFTIELLDE